MEDMLYGILLGAFATIVVNYMGIFLFLDIHEHLDHGEEE